VTTPDPDDLPPDVVEWLEETYLPDGVAIWREQYRQAGAKRRELMLRLARTDPMGT